MYPEKTKSALQEFFLMHYCTIDANLADVNEIYRAHEKMRKFMASWLFLKSELEKGADPDIRTTCFNSGKVSYGESRENLREWFADMNLVLFNRKDGPQLSEFIRIYSKENFIKRVDARLKNYMSLFFL